ncbi:unnamed protein product [Nippostrongylus brasiliensis]|uniref:Ribokinase n=1 Tax=Nippostrongylus brasiliensis TaxID=27835 RepID=A0A0N4XXL9_NIPBR|nr:unnamed protein product [Nippostrongylus brasiliensis]
MADRKKIVIFGGVVQDLISYTDVFPRPGESVRGNSFLMGGGGKGANQAVAAARLGADVQLIARVGNDTFGRSNIEGLRQSGVDVSQMELSDTSHTGMSTITVNAQGENCIVMTLGANMELDEESAERHAETINNAAIVMTQAEVSRKGNRRVFEIAKKHNVMTFWNPAPGVPDTDMDMVALTDIICTNENEARETCSKLEAEFITGIAQNSLEDAKAAAEQMLTMGPKHAIVTMGAKGVVLASKEEATQHIPVMKVDAVDTTGAGDCFCGSLAYFLVRNEFCVRNAIQRAAGIAALSVQRKGTQTSYWSRQEIEREHPELLA